MITAYVDGREFEILCILIFVRGMFVGGILTKLCCRSVQVIVDSRNQLESMGKTSTRDMSVEVNDLIPPVFADWLDMHESYYRTEKGTVLRLTPFCSYAWPCYTSGEVSLQPNVCRATVLRTVAFMSKCLVKPQL